MSGDNGATATTIPTNDPSKRPVESMSYLFHVGDGVFVERSITGIMKIMFSHTLAMLKFATRHSLWRKRDGHANKTLYRKQVKIGDHTYHMFVPDRLEDLGIEKPVLAGTPALGRSFDMYHVDVTFADIAGPEFDLIETVTRLLTDYKKPFDLHDMPVCPFCGENHQAEVAVDEDEHVKNDKLNMPESFRW